MELQEYIFLQLLREKAYEEITPEWEKEYDSICKKINGINNKNEMKKFKIYKSKAGTCIILWKIFIGISFNKKFHNFKTEKNCYLLIEKLRDGLYGRRDYIFSV